MKYFCEECGIGIRKSYNEVEKCYCCGKILCPKHAHFKQDENNISITKNAPILCIECYNKRY